MTRKAAVGGAFALRAVKITNVNRSRNASLNHLRLLETARTTVARIPTASKMAVDATRMEEEYSTARTESLPIEQLFLVRNACLQRTA